MDLALVGGNLWVTLSGSDQVAVIDRDSLTSIKGPYSVGDRPWKMSVGLGSVWITNRAEKGSVSRLDPETGQRRQEDIPVGMNPDELAVGDGLVYVANRASNTISVLRT